jgi:ribosomal protein S18 acetylase RimI-like enzyme
MFGGPTFRPAVKADALHLAALIDIAGRGVPMWFWRQSAAPGQSAIEIGRERAMREEGGFSYRNALLAEAAGTVIGKVLGYREPDPFGLPDLDALPAFARPLVELESLVPGSWYLNAIATYPEARGRGHGRRLMEEAFAVAAGTGTTEISLITEEANTGARRFYERMGFATLASRPCVALEGHGSESNSWLLMARRLT